MFDLCVVLFSFHLFRSVDVLTFALFFSFLFCVVSFGSITDATKRTYTIGITCNQRSIHNRYQMQSAEHMEVVSNAIRRTYRVGITCFPWGKGSISHEIH